MKTSNEGRKFISTWEGNKLTAYLDSVGVWTIGVGHTSAAGEPKVFKGMKITAEESDSILSKDLEAVENEVNRLVKVPLTQNQFDSLVSLTFNIGGTAFKNSTLLRKLNSKDYNGAADQFLVWNKGTVNGKKVVIKGLANRRAAEREQFLKSGNNSVIKVVEIPVEKTQEVVDKVSEDKVNEVSENSNTFLQLLMKVLKAIFK